MIRTSAAYTPLLTLRPIALLTAWTEAARQRRALARLDAAALTDVGLTKKDAEAEADRPFWDVPQTWRR